LLRSSEANKLKVNQVQLKVNQGEGQKAKDETGVRSWLAVPMLSVSTTPCMSTSRDSSAVLDTTGGSLVVLEWKPVVLCSFFLRIVLSPVLCAGCLPSHLCAIFSLNAFSTFEILAFSGTFKNRTQLIFLFQIAFIYFNIFSWCIFTPTS
jgi:hypothetical protein